MGYKMGFILSLIFIVQLFVIAGDVMSIQVIYTNLDAVSVTAGQAISKYGEITDSVVLLVENQAHAHIEALTSQTPSFGSIYEYRIYTSYTPYVISSEPMEICISRSVIIGYQS